MNAPMAPEWPRRVVEVAFGRPVAVDASLLRAGAQDAPEVSIACSEAEAPLRAAGGAWIVRVKPHAYGRLTSQRARSVEADHVLEGSEPGMFWELDALGITDITCDADTGPGRVFLSASPGSGPVDQTVAEVADWLSGVVRVTTIESDWPAATHSAARQHRHVTASLSTLPWSICTYRMSGCAHIRTATPVLPQDIAAVWLLATFARDGLLWDKSGWRVIDASLS